MSGVDFPWATAGRTYVFRSVVQSIGVISLLLVLYYLLPVESRPHQSVVLRVAAGIALFAAGLVYETSHIARADHPLLRAVVALATVVPLFIVVFAWLYLTMSHSAPGAFNQPLSRTEALYFTVTVFSTVGFGDIVPKTDVARLVVTFQMLTDLIVLAAAVRLIFGMATRVTAARAEAAQ